MVAVNLVAVGMQGPQGPPGPAGSGGLSGTYYLLVSTGGPYGSVQRSGSLPLVGGDSEAGQMTDVVTVPACTYPPGQVLSNIDVVIDNIPTSTDGFDFEVFVTVVSLDGTNVMYVQGSANVAGDAGRTEIISSNLNLSDGQLGSDLTWDSGSGVSTTAGGVYGIAVGFFAGWD